MCPKILISIEVLQWSIRRDISMMKYIWFSGTNASGHNVQSPSSRNNQLGRTYENVELQNRPVAEDDEQVVDMNSKRTEKQCN